MGVEAHTGTVPVSGRAILPLIQTGQNALRRQIRPTIHGFLAVIESSRGRGAVVLVEGSHGRRAQLFNDHLFDLEFIHETLDASVVVDDHAASRSQRCEEQSEQHDGQLLRTYVKFGECQNVRVSVEAVAQNVKLRLSRFVMPSRCRPRVQGKAIQAQEQAQGDLALGERAPTTSKQELLEAGTSTSYLLFQLPCHVIAPSITATSLAPVPCRIQRAGPISGP